MGKVIDLVKKLREKATYENLERVLLNDWARQRKGISPNEMSIETGKRTRHMMGRGVEIPVGEGPDQGFMAEFYRDTASGWNPLTQQYTKFQSDGPVKAVLDDTLTHRPEWAFGADIPDSLKRALSKVRNKTNVFFADGTEI